MDASTILESLASRGVVVAADGGQLRVRGSLTPADRQIIRQHKHQLLTALQLRTRSAVTLPPTVEGIPLADLKREGADNWPELASNPELLRAFARSCIHTGTLRPRPAPFDDPDADLIGRPDSDWVDICLAPSPADLRRRQEGGR